MTDLVRDCVIGDVYEIFLDATQTTTPKRTYCICVHEKWFFAIHTSEMNTDNLPIKKSDHPFLDHDSHVKCGYVLELDENQPITRHLGSLSDKQLGELIDMVECAEGLTGVEKRPISKSLTNIQTKRKK
jgi:hypothetical protein